jgi:hypothetical protein
MTKSILLATGLAFVIHLASVHVSCKKPEVNTTPSVYERDLRFPVIVCDKCLYDCCCLTVLD